VCALWQDCPAHRLATDKPPLSADGRCADDDWLNRCTVGNALSIGTERCYRTATMDMNRFSETLQYVADQGRIIIDAWVPFSVFLGFLGLATWRTVTWIYRFRLENAKSSLETLRLENEALHRNLALADLLNSKGNVDLINDLHVLRDRLSSKTDDKNSDVKQLGIKLEELNRSLSVLSSKRSGIGKEVYQAGSNANGTFIRFTDGSQTC